MSGLPPGWASVVLGDVTTVRKDKKDPKHLPNMPFIGLEAFESHTGRIASTQDTSALKSAISLFFEGDVLYGRLRPYLNKVVVPNFEGAASAEFIVFLRNEILEPHYLQQVLMSPDFVSFTAVKSTGDRPRVSYESISSYEFPVPPVGEQQRIVEKLDSLSTKSKRARDQLDRVPRLVEKYKQALLAAAFRGDLTADWRATNASKMMSEWNERQLVEICDPRRPITYGVIKLGSEIPNGVPCLRTSNVRWLRVDTEGMKKISPKLSSEYARTVLRGDEVLVNVRGTLGGVVVATSSMKGWNVSREVAVAPVDAAVVEPNYVAFWIGADASQRWLNRVEKGVAYTGINIEDLRKLPVEFPSIDEQRQIIRRIQTAFSRIDHLALEATNARKLIDHLDQAVLAKGFQGELVAQDPSDEPASVLLERIRAQRGATPTFRGRNADETHASGQHHLPEVFRA